MGAAPVRACVTAARPMAGPPPPQRLGLCGHGWVVENGYAPALRSAQSAFQVAGVADPDPAARARASADWPGASVTADVESLLAARLDAVLVASPNPQHLAQTLAVLDAGLPCLVEKPMLRDLRDLALLEGAGRGGLLVPAVACRHRADTRRWLAALADLGPLHRLSLSWERRRGVPASSWHHRLAEGWTGVYADLGAHLVDLLGASLEWRTEGLEGGPVSRRSDRSSAPARWHGGVAEVALETETAAKMGLRAGAVHVDLAMAWTSDRPGDLVRLRAEGWGGSVVLEGLFGFSNERRVPHQRVSRFGPAGDVLWQASFEPGPGLQQAAFAAVLDDFARSIRHGHGTDWRPIRFAAAIGSLMRAAA